MFIFKVLNGFARNFCGTELDGFCYSAVSFFLPLTFSIPYLIKLWNCLLDSVTYRFSDIFHSPSCINRDTNRHGKQNPPDISIIQRSLFIIGLLKWGTDITLWKLDNIYTAICFTDVLNLYRDLFYIMFFMYTVISSTECSLCVPW
jgi:hypothetical protein